MNLGACVCHSFVQLESLKLALAAVKMENLELKKEISWQTLASLPPLPVRGMKKEAVKSEPDDEEAPEQQPAASSEATDTVKSLSHHASKLLEVGFLWCELLNYRV